MKIMTMTPNNNPKRKAYISVASVVMILCCLCLCISPIRSRVDNNPKTATARIVTKTPGTPAKTATPRNTPRPTRTLAPLDALRRKVLEALGDTNRDVARISVFKFDEVGKSLEIEFAADDSLTDGLIKSGIQMDIVKVLDAVYHSPVKFDVVVVSASFPTVDKFGNSNETVLVTATYHRATLDKINWKSFKFTNVYVIADDLYLDPLAVP